MNRIASSVLTALVLAASVAAVGCSADTGDDADANSADVKLSEVVPTGAQVLLTNEPATADAAKALGVTAWNVYFANDNDRGVEGITAFGTDARGEVAYAVVIAGSRSSAADGQASVAFVKYDDAGPAPDQTISASAMAALQAELGRLGGILDDQSQAEGIVPLMTRGENAAVCAVGIAVGLMFVASVPGAIAMSATLAPAAAAVTATDLAIAAGVSTVVVGGAVAGAAKLAGVSFKEAANMGRGIWELGKLGVRQTGKSCKAAVTGH